MSGAGRSTVGNVLEDEGWFVIDNLPPQLLDGVADLVVEAVEERNDRPSATRSGKAVPPHAPIRAAAIVDVRTRGFFSNLRHSLDALAERGLHPSLIFLDATDEALVRRFESVRRPHPLQGTGRLLDAIQTERELIADLRSRADFVIDTSGLNVHQLARKVQPPFSRDRAPGTRMAVMSFGFKYGLPLDADYVFDLRFLPNPYWIPELRPSNGTDEAVATFVLAQEGATDFIEQVVALLRTAMAGYQRENRRYATVAVGCTGGKHRSVAIAERISVELASDDIETFVVHRDLGQE
ncbi:MAG: RNase adapter RapZ [Actinomycetia bacterium]|nr:RNase adapter RapZ [Actinomycetes bacterium]